MPAPVCQTAGTCLPESHQDEKLSDFKSERIRIDRHVLTCDDANLLSVAHETKPKSSIQLRLKRYYSRHFGRHYCLQTSLSYLQCVFPFVGTLLHYRWRTDLLGDLSSGLTVGVMNVPQGMAYAMLAGLPPVYGLYASFIPPLLYAFLGRCPQLSLGTFAVISLLLSEPIRRLCHATVNDANVTMKHTTSVGVCYDPQLLETDESYDFQQMNTTATLVDIRPTIAITLSFLIGIVQMAIGLLRIGSLACYLAPAMVDGFVTGAAFHVLSSQISSLFGVKEAAKGDGIGSIVLVYINLIKHLLQTNLVTFCISVVSILFLLVVKMLFDPLCQRYGHCSLPLPAELILVVFGTISSEFIYLNANHNVSVVGPIAKGMPAFTIPQWNLMDLMITDAVVIGFTSTFLTLSLIKLFAMKYHYDIRFNQELTSLGVITVGSSLLSSFAPSGSVSRSMVCEGAGAKTTLNGIASAVLIVFVLLFLGPYFSNTPTCILSSIIVVALKNVLIRVCDLRRMWRTFKRDFFLYFVTFLVTLIFDVTMGLIVGAICCLLALSADQRTLHVTPLYNVPGTELFLPDISVKDFGVNSTDSIITCQLVGSLNFASAERLPISLNNILHKGTYETCPQRPIIEKALKDEHLAVIPNGTSDANTTTTSSESELTKVSRPDLKAFILLDINGLSSVDPYGAQCLFELHKELSLKGFAIVYVGDLQRHKCLDTSSWSRAPSTCLSYPSMYDAYVACHNDLAHLSSCADSSTNASKF